MHLIYSRQSVLLPSRYIPTILTGKKIPINWLGTSYPDDLYTADPSIDIIYPCAGFYVQYATFDRLFFLPIAYRSKNGSFFISKKIVYCWYICIFFFIMYGIKYTMITRCHTPPTNYIRFIGIHTLFCVWF